VRGWQLAAAPAVAAGVAAGVLLFDPFDAHAVGCPFHGLTGWWCPGCGATRATWLVLHGDLAGAARHNVLYLPALAFLVLRYLHLAVPARTSWLPGAVRQPTSVPTAALRWLVVGVVAFTVARNLPAFEWLAPPDPASPRG
jgi:hypothetical protein